MCIRDRFEAYGEVFVATEDGSAGTKGNVLDAIREQNLTADVIYACGPDVYKRQFSYCPINLGVIE